MFCPARGPFLDAEMVGCAGHLPHQLTAGARNGGTNFRHRHPAPDTLTTTPEPRPSPGGLPEEIVNHPAEREIVDA